jgi:hypothetical protein
MKDYDRFSAAGSRGCVTALFLCQAFYARRSDAPASRAVPFLKMAGVILTILLFTSLLVDLAASQIHTQSSVLWDSSFVLFEAGSNPKLLAQGDTLHAICEYGGGIPYRRSTNGGLTWEAAREIWLTDSITDYPYRLHFAGKTGRIFIVCVDHVDNYDQRLGWISSSDGGSTWSVRKNLRHSPFNEYVTSATASNDTVVATVEFRDSIMWHRRLTYSIDAGQTWPLSQDSIVTRWDPTIALVGGGLHLVHVSYQPATMSNELIYRRSSDFGVTWQYPQFVSTVDYWNANIPFISGWHNRLIATWRDAKYDCPNGFGCSILGRISTNGGESWGDEIILTDEPEGVRSATASGPDVILAGWDADYFSYGEVHAKVSADGGHTWSTAKNFGDGGLCSVAGTNTAVHVAFHRSEGNCVWYARGVPKLSMTVGYGARWQLVAVPVKPDDNHASSLYPSSISEAFGFVGGSYQAEDTLSVGYGYWIKFQTQDTTRFEGIPVSGTEILLHEGWNMIGSFSTPVLTQSLSTDPAGIIDSHFFTYERQYVAVDTLLVGRGYWVKTKQAGALRMVKN